MDPRQFDALSRTLANGVSRRQAVTRWGAAGVLAGLAAMIGRGRGEAAHRLVQAETCSLDIVANVRLGPSEGAILQGSVPGELRGEIAFALDPEGRIDGGKWRLEGGGELAVSGQATGQALTLRVQAGIGQTIVLTGAGEEDFAVCAGAADGLFTGPQRGDIGDWHAIATSLGAPQATTPPAPGVTSTPIPATAVPTATPGTSPTATTPPGSGTATATAPATATETPTTTATPTATATPEATATVTPTPTPTATPEPTATPTATPDPCPTGTVTCSGVCVDLLIDPANCGACGNACTFGICAAGVCTFLQACLSPQVFCGDACVDLQTNPAHCGACGNACQVVETCAGGECQPGVLAPA
jgi:hypothetical protein